MALSRGSRWFLAFGALALAGVAAGVWWMDTSIFVDDVAPGQPVEVTVERGQSVSSVGDELADLGVVGSSFRFRVAAEDADLADALRPGIFELETGMGIDAAIAVLAEGPETPPTVTFTIAEGLTVDETLQRLAEQFDAYSVEDFRAVLTARRTAQDGAGALRLPAFWPVIDELAEQVEQPFEGAFWPETYEVNDTASPQEVLQRMVDQLETEMVALERELEDTATPLPQGRERYDTLIVASLIERESRLEDERATIGGVISNRLADGMPLQIDATVVYAVGERPDGRVLLEDLEVDSPYNTYQVEGLPPTPISGVGAGSLRAAAAPADVPYLYYVLDPACDGSHRFAETLEEHDANVEELRAAGSCQIQDGEVVEGQPAEADAA